MDKYEQQASDWLAQTNTTLQARHLRYGKYFPSDEESRDVWEIKMTRGSSEYIFAFGSSLNDREEWRAEKVGSKANKYFKDKITQEEADKLIKKYIANNDIDEWGEMGSKHRPTAYSVLAGLETNLYPANVDEFAEEYGYTKPSEAIKVYEAVAEQVAQLSRMYGEKELESLGEIQ